MQTIARTFLFLAASATCSTALPAQQQWTQLAQVTPPPAAGAAMAYDVLHDRTVWFGGREQLTNREQTILLQLAQGKSNKAVAFALDISVRTVETHRKNIKRKLGISSTAGLTRYALEHGVLQGTGVSL